MKCIRGIKFLAMSITVVFTAGCGSGETSYSGFRNEEATNVAEQDERTEKTIPRVLNPSFESDGDGWTIHKGTYGVDIANGVSHDGEKSLRIKTAQPGMPYEVARITTSDFLGLENGQAYRISFWVKCGKNLQASEADEFRLYAYFTYGQPSANMVLTTCDNKWTERHLDFAFDGQTMNPLNIQIAMPRGTDDELYLDDFTVKKIHL